VTYIEPLTLILLFLLGIGIMRLPRQQPRRLFGWALFGTFLLSWPPAEWVLSRPLEGWYPTQPFHPQPGLDAIVVLSSAVTPASYERPYPVPDLETYNRCLHAAWIHKQTGLPVLVSGGRARPRDPAFAETMRDLLLTEGVPANQIWLEVASQSTHGNAVKSAAILREHSARRIVLVVDARSMWRAEACFRREGFVVTPAPNRFLYLEANARDWIPGWRAVRGNEITLHEMAGLIWYRLRGWV
jgi:uncharacterized SAM-binding protein YcdF (DUF218 family)